MAVKKDARTFRPERPIYLNEENTNLKSRDEVDHAILKLRDRGWLVTYGEKVRPFHMSFNDELVFEEFKDDCQSLRINLKSPVIKPDDFERLIAEEENEGQKIEGAEDKSTYDDPTGQRHVADE